MIFFYRGVHGAQFRASLIERGTGSETRKKFRHAMRALSHHRGSEMVRAARDIRDDLGLLRIRDARLEHADDRGGAITKTNGLANDGGIAIQRVRPKAIGEDKDAGSFGAVIFWSDETSQHRAQTHHLEIGSIDHSADDFARLANADKRERYCREVAKLAQCLDPRLEIMNLRHRPGAVFLTLARCALPDIDQAGLVAVDQRLDEYAANERENGGIGADAKRERDDNDKREPR